MAATPGRSCSACGGGPSGARSSVKLTVAAPRRCTGAVTVAPLTSCSRPQCYPPACTAASAWGAAGASGTGSWGGRSSSSSAFECCCGSVGASEACHPPRYCRSPTEAASERPHPGHSPNPATSRSYASPAMAAVTVAETA